MEDNYSSTWTDLEPAFKETVDFDKHKLLPLDFGHEKESKCLDNVPEKPTKGDTCTSAHFIEFLMKVKRIIKEDERRFEIYDNTPRSSLATHVSYSADMDTKEIEIAMDNMMQMIVESLNRYYNQLREMDNKTTILQRENSDLKNVLEKKNSELRSLEKQTRKPDSSSAFQSLNVDVVNKRNLLQISQLRDDVKSFETENEELQKERRQLKKELRQYKSKCDDLNDDVKEIEKYRNKLESQNKQLKTQLKEFKNKEWSSSDDEASNEAMEKLKSEIKEKDSEIRLLKESVGNLENTLSKTEPQNSENANLVEKLKSELKELKIKSGQDKDDLVEELRVEKEKLNETIKNLEEEHQKEKADLKDLITKKDEALQTTRKKMLAQSDTLKSENITLKEKLEQCENEKKRKQEALISSAEKIKGYRTMEDELKKMKQLTWQLNSKEGELQNMTKELKTCKEKLDEKIKECELIKKEKAGFQEEVNNMKLLAYRNKKPEK